MTANELRIGVTEIRMCNLLFDKSGKYVLAKKLEIYEEDDMVYDEINGQPSYNFGPILLTEEWLIKLGFEPNGCGDFVYDNNENDKNMLFELSYDFDNKIFTLDGTVLSEVCYVHDVQNLYFALTGKELKIK